MAKANSVTVHRIFKVSFAHPGRDRNRPVRRCPANADLRWKMRFPKGQSYTRAKTTKMNRPIECKVKTLEANGGRLEPHHTMGGGLFPHSARPLFSWGYSKSFLKVMSLVL